LHRWTDMTVHQECPYVTKYARMVIHK